MVGKVLGNIFLSEKKKTEVLWRENLVPFFFLPQIGMVWEDVAWSIAIILWLRGDKLKDWGWENNKIETIAAPNLEPTFGLLFEIIYSLCFSL